MRIRDTSAHRSCLIAGSRRAITREVHCSHGCCTFPVEKGNGGAGIGAKYVYIEGNNHYLWRGEGPVGLPVSMGGGRDVAGRPGPVWQHGSQPGSWVLLVSRVNIPPQRVFSLRVTTKKHSYQAEVNNSHYHS